MLFNSLALVLLGTGWNVEVPRLFWRRAPTAGRAASNGTAERCNATLVVVLPGQPMLDPAPVRARCNGADLHTTRSHGCVGYHGAINLGRARQNPNGQAPRSHRRETYHGCECQERLRSHLTPVPLTTSLPVAQTSAGEILIEARHPPHGTTRPTTAGWLPSDLISRLWVLFHDTTLGMETKWMLHVLPLRNHSKLCG